MKELRRYIFALLSVSFFVLALFQESQTLNKKAVHKLIQIFQNDLIQQESKLSDYLNVAEERLRKNTADRNYAALFSDFNRLFEKEGLGFILFDGSKMVYWSSNQFAFPNLQNRFSTQNRLLNLENGIYTAQKRIVGSFQLIGLVHLKNKYSYENQFLNNHFVEPFSLPAEFRLEPQKGKNSYEIHDITSEYLFSVVPQGSSQFSQSGLYLTSVFYLLGFLFMLLAIYRQVLLYRDENFVLKMIVVLVALFSIYWLHIIFGFPRILNHIGIFSPQYYAVSRWLPSLGDFFLITILLFFWSLVFIREFSFISGLKKIHVIPAFLFSGLLYQLAGFMISNLIGNSNIAYKLNQITDIDQYSISSFLAVAMLLFSVFLIHLKIIEKTERLIRRRTFIRFHLIAVSVSIGLSILIPSGAFYILSLFFLVSLLQYQVQRMRISLYSLSYAILFISLFSVFSLLVVNHTIKKRDVQIQKVRAINLSAEQDPMAEVLLARMENQFNTDSIIFKLLVPPYADLESYLTRTYFGGYFRKYDIQFTFCSGSDSLLIQPENINEPCFPYFKQMIDQHGIRVPGSKFYFMNYMNGRVSYFGEINYQQPDEPKGFSIFIEINSKVISEGIGFPELLMDRSLIKPFRYKYLSYAKYYDDELVNRSGDYNYNIYLKSYNIDKTGPEFQLLKWDGYDHLIYRFDEKNYILVSNRSLRFIDYVISFPYIFVFYFVFALSVALVGNPNFRKLIIPQDLRFRIQFSIISVVLISLLFVAGGTIYYNIREYRDRHQYDLQEKMKSISEEIKNRLVYVNSITPELQQWLFRELYKLSNIFRTDINIYDVNGNLLATSRPEIFSRGVISERMNSVAFYELSELYHLNYVQPERIGNLSYLSAYEPIINNRGDYLGYLNLPYFTREDELKQGISTFVVAFINIYLILFLTSVIVAVVLSNRITQPLSLIREKLRGIQLGKKSEQINYQAEDEIGALVREYNHKVDELAESAELLARSERESAWREMAKQIAHEIKNPLTPMKLNIQYLQRAKEEGNEHYDDFFDRVTRNLIEQIDTLSGIATEFSNFAQIPKAKNEVFNLVEVIESVCALFEPNQNLQFTIDTGGQTSIRIFADKEQFSRAILNLIKNGIQAIPPDQTGEIRIVVKKENSTALLSISDNGTGISPEAEENLFQPNFTTKTSGMGLGLSIVKNIINNFGGKIWYSTRLNDGTTFYIEVPLHE